MENFIDCAVWKSTKASNFQVNIHYIVNFRYWNWTSLLLYSVLVVCINGVKERGGGGGLGQKPQNGKPKFPNLVILEYLKKSFYRTA